jgi:hypothetical protein
MSQNRFRILLDEFCTALQIPKNVDASGVEFEAEGYRVLIAHNPRDEERLFIGVSVMNLAEPSAALLMALHQLNLQSRLEHDWVISVDAAHWLSVHTQKPLQACDAEALQALMVEGIERAQVLRNLCEAPDHEVPSGPLGVPAIFIRG